MVISIINIVNQISKKKELALISSIMVIIFGICTFFVIKTPSTQAKNETELVPNFVGQNISEAITWGIDNNIEITQNYEYSDTVLENIIFAQDVLANSKLDSISKIALTISGGYNYDKLVILQSFVGQDIDLFLEEMKSLHLNNVKISYETSNYNARNTIITQSKNGEVRRNDEIKITVSLGKKSDLTELSMPNLIGETLFNAKLLLDQDAINYELKYEFSNQDKDIVINQSIAEGEIVKPFSTKVLITVSKGEKIIVPDLLSMSVADIVKWINDNKLKISLSDTYDSNIEVGKVVSANYKENDEISEGTLIKITTSKGALKMPSFKTLAEFRTWANNYNIKYEEEYEFNNSVPKGNIIKFSLETNDLIDVDDPIVVTISSGKSITIPNFVGKTKSEISSTCSNLGLNCSFTYGSYSTTPKDTAIAQNKKAGSSVISGTSVLITLSKGSAKTFTVELYESLLTFGNADASIKSLKGYFANNYPGVTFNFSTKKTNVYPNSGYIHEDSPVKDGTKVTQGKSYSVIITTK